MIMHDGVCTQIMGTLTGGAFLVAFALLLGASNFVIGLIGALAPLSQLLQVPAIYLIEKTAHRRLLVVVSSTLSRLFWFVLAVIPWFVPADAQVAVFVFALFMYFGLGTISGLSWSSWIRDLIPDHIMGSFMAKRMAIATAVGAALSLLAGYGVDIYKQYYAEAGIYSIYFALGGIFGLLGVIFLARTPEPKMEANPRPEILKLIKEPLGDTNFRQLLIFLGSWNFAVNLVAPFFTVYMLQRLGLSMTVVITLAVVSQVVNVAFFRLWGKLADRFSNKSVLVEAGPLFILTFIIWPFTTLPESYWGTIPLLLAIHALAGMSTAGVMLCTGNIALKLAPKGKATAYLAVNALVSGIAATVAPILGGILSTFLEGETVTLTFHWLSQSTGLNIEFATLSLKGLDFLFLTAFIFGLYALHRLLAVKEVGEVEKGIVLGQFYMEIRKAVSNISNVSGMRDLVYFPYNQLMTLFVGRRR